MANNYLQFSTMIETSGTEELAWAEEHLIHVSELYEKVSAANMYDGWGVAKNELERLGYDLDQDYLGFNYKVGRNGIQIYAEEYGEPSQVATFMLLYLRKFRPNGSLSFTWALTCDKMRPDEFSGGGAFITAKGIQNFESSDLIHQAYTAWLKETVCTGASRCL